ncbi:MAG: alpha/beta family hydrolase, partial [Candidatus Neomarinimicrobiota bacterium]
PGSAYPKEGPLIVALAHHAREIGWAALRFDWRYTTAGGGPSGNRRREVEELEAVLAYARALPRLSGRPLVVAGKSLGAAVAWRVFRARPEVAAVVLLTPVFRDAGSGEKSYPGLAGERRPVHLLAGNRDPLNALPVMHDYLRSGGENVVATVVDGDHGLQVTRKKDESSQAANRANIAAAVQQVLAGMGELDALSAQQRR